jgi:gallate dioxygenase
MDLLERDPQRPGRDDACRTRPAAGIEDRSDHVGWLMRGAMPSASMPASHLLPAVHGRIATAIYGRCRAAPSMHSHRCSARGRSAQLAASRSSKARTLRFRAQREGLPPERLPAPHGRAAHRERFPPIPREPSSHAGLSAESAISSAGATGAADPLRCHLFMHGKAGRRGGRSNLHIYAAMRGQTLEEFQKTRQCPRGALFGGGGRPGVDV